MRLLAFSLSVLLLAPLAGCVTTGDSADKAATKSPTAQQQAMVFEPEPGLAPKERYLKSLSLLEVGQAGQAKAELRAYLADDPGGRYAKRSIDLLKQIDADPQKELGKEHFLYKMQAGDSLSSVAKQYLGDPLKFHLLARYNDLDNPSQMKAGQTIKVPGKRPAQVARQEPRTEPESGQEPQASEDDTDQDRGVAREETGTAAEQGQGVVAGSEAAEPAASETAGAETTEEKPADTQLSVIPPAEQSETETLEAENEAIQAIILKAQDLSSEHDYGAAAKELELGLAKFPDAVQMKEQAAANYVTFADVLIAKGRFDDARTAAERANELVPGYGEAKERLARLDRQEEANQYYLKGKELLAADKPIEAFDAFGEATKIVPDHPAAAERANLIPVVTEEWHRKAMIFYRRQDLDAALGIWDNKVLKIDPDYGPALLYRDQAIELKERLKNLQAEPAEKQQ